LLSNIQTRSTKTITTVTVVIAITITVAALLQLHEIPLILSIPFFLIPISTYTTIIGLNSRQEHNRTQNYSYYFTWAAIMLAISITWILLYENMGVIMGIIAVLVITLGYVYLNRAKSVMIRT